MKTRRVHNLVAAALACGLILTSISLVGQSTHVPVSPPVSVQSQQPSLPKGPLPFALPKLHVGAGFNVGQSYDGIDFLTSNCPCLPPDTNAAVGNNYVVETVNLQNSSFRQDHRGRSCSMNPSAHSSGCPPAVTPT